MDKVSVVDVEEFSAAMETSFTNSDRTILTSNHNGLGTVITMAGRAITRANPHISSNTCIRIELFYECAVSICFYFLLSVL